MVLEKIHVNLKSNCSYATRRPVFLLQHFKMQDLILLLIFCIWSTVWLSLQLSVSTIKIMLTQYFVNFCLSYRNDFLVKCVKKFQCSL